MPLLVARGDLEYPIIGYNVIEEVMKSPDQVGKVRKLTGLFSYYRRYRIFPGLQRTLPGPERRPCRWESD